VAFKFNPFSGTFDDVADVADKVTGPASSTDEAIVRYDGTTGKLVQNSSVTIDDSGNMIIAGDLTVNGTTTTLNTATLDVEDTNITVNVGGNDASSEGAGLTVERTGTNGSFVYEDALTSKFKIGALGSEVEIADLSSAQTLTNKTINASNNTITNITNTEIDAAAAISLSKLAALTASRALQSDGSGVISVSAVTSTELGYVSGVTSAIQTQINGKVNNGTLTTKGDIFVRTAGGVGRLGVGTDGQVLTADSVATEGVSWQTPSNVQPFTVNSVATNTNATLNETYLVDSTGGVVQITLPTPTADGFVKVKDSGGDANGNNITVARNGSENIDGTAANWVMDSNYEAKTFVSDGTDWWVF